MNNMNALTEQDVHKVVSVFAATKYRGKSVDEVLDIAEQMVGFTIESVIENALSLGEIQDWLHSAYTCYHEYHPESEDEGLDDDPKNDLNYWRTGIRVFHF